MVPTRRATEARGVNNNRAAGGQAHDETPEACRLGQSARTPTAAFALREHHDEQRGDPQSDHGDRQRAAQSRSHQTEEGQERHAGLSGNDDTRGEDCRATLSKRAVAVGVSIHQEAQVPPLGEGAVASTPVGGHPTSRPPARLAQALPRRTSLWMCCL